MSPLLCRGQGRWAFSNEKLPDDKNDKWYWSKKEDNSIMTSQDKAWFCTWPNHNEYE